MAGFSPLWLRRMVRLSGVSRENVEKRVGNQRPELPLTALQPESGQHKEANLVRLFVLLPLLPT